MLAVGTYVTFGQLAQMTMNEDIEMANPGVWPARASAGAVPNPYFTCYMVRDVRVCWSGLLVRCQLDTAAVH